MADVSVIVTSFFILPDVCELSAVDAMNCIQDYYENRSKYFNASLQ